ncbi:hypothetical protein ACQJBY_035527 [Aegilops geniculata]
MELHRFVAEIDHLRALIVVEERNAEAEEDIFRSAGRTLLLCIDEQLNPKQINCIASCCRHRQLHRKLLPTSSCRKFMTSATTAQVCSSLGFFNIRANRESRGGRDGAGGKWIHMVCDEFLL